MFLNQQITKYCTRWKSCRGSMDCEAADYSGSTVLGSPAYMHVFSEERSKLDAKSVQCVFLGYQKGVKGFKLWDPKANKVVISRDVVFDEKAMVQRTQGEETRTPKNSSGDEHAVQVELEAEERDNTAHEVEGSNTVRLEHRGIAGMRRRRTSKPPDR